jgi:hypothetical protein
MPDRHNEVRHLRQNLRKATKLLAFGVCLLLHSSASAQAYKLRENAPVTIRGFAGLPNAVSSQMFKTAFRGIFEGGLSLNYKLGKHLHAGVGYRFSYFRNNENVFTYFVSPVGNLSFDTRIESHSVFARVGIDKFFSEIGYMSYTLNGGYMLGKYRNVIGDTSLYNRPFVEPALNGPYLQPEVSLNLIAEKSLSFSIFFSYTLLLQKFNPKAPRFNQVEEVSLAPNKFLVSWITFGFGFSVLFKNQNIPKDLD